MPGAEGQTRTHSVGLVVDICATCFVGTLVVGRFDVGRFDVGVLVVAPIIGATAATNACFVGCFDVGLDVGIFLVGLDVGIFVTGLDVGIRVGDIVGQGP